MAAFQNRHSDHPIQEQFISRHSSRAFSEERLSEEELMSLFEAARWAPSCYNNQPWRFLYARRGEKEWDAFFNALIDFNKSWCKEADTLVVIISRDTFEHNGKPSSTASLDTGAAWMSLALEAHARGFIAHGMAGFNAEQIRKELSIPEGFTVEAMIAIGKAGKKENLPQELQEKETPSLRKPVKEISRKGSFSFQS